MSNLYLALIPFFAWALGDFLIQKSTRATSGARILFYLCVFSTILFFPFINLDSFKNISHINFLVFTGFFGFIYAITIFQAFKVAKLSVVESVIALELPLTVFLATTFAGEYISSTNIILLCIIFAGMMLTVSKENFIYKIFNHLKQNKKSFLEKGFYLALGSVVLSSIFNFLVGFSGLESADTLFSIWVIHIVIGVCTLLLMLFTKELGEIYHDLKTHPYLILLASFFDTIAWAGYIFAVSKNSISSVTAVSEGYIALAAFLGYYFNREKLIFTQKLGMLIVFMGTVLFIFYN
jgi:drug/metabolite transporter (DMT)-like permease